MSKKSDLKSFKDVTDLLMNTDVTDPVRQEQLYNRLKFKMETGTVPSLSDRKEDIPMNKKKWTTLAVSAAAIVCLGGVFSTTSYAHGMIESLLARFQVGNMEIKQYKELPESTVKTTEVNQQAQAARSAPREAPKTLTLKEARAAIGVDFPVPAWLSEHYQFVNCVVQGEHMVEVQYQKDGEFISLLISSGGKNGISTEDEVKKETIGGRTVYFANGIVIWEQEGFTYELYQMGAEESFDAQAVGQMIGTMSTKNE